MASLIGASLYPNLNIAKQLFQLALLWRRATNEKFAQGRRRPEYSALQIPHGFQRLANPPEITVYLSEITKSIKTDSGHDAHCRKRDQQKPKNKFARKRRAKFCRDGDQGLAHPRRKISIGRQSYSTVRIESSKM
jgi:hypothetical protein